MILSSVNCTGLTGTSVTHYCDSDASTLVEAELHQRQCSIGVGELVRIEQINHHDGIVGWSHEATSQDGKFFCDTSFVYVVGAPEP